MNIDSLLNLSERVVLYTLDGQKSAGKVMELSDEESFLFLPETSLSVVPGAVVKISDGQDAIFAKVTQETDRGLEMCLERGASVGNERRSDVRIYDKIYCSARFICHADEKPAELPRSLDRIRANKLIIDSFLKGKYGYPGADEVPYTRESPYNQILWEMNRKLDLLVHMLLAEEFKDLMSSRPLDVNISASGIRFIANTSFEVGDLLEINLILPMVPLLFIRLMGEVIRQKNVTSYETNRYAVAVTFLRMDPDAKDDIIRYLFRRQRELLRKRQNHTLIENH
ncbi:MAG: PilZ domain-containing protein [Desulfomonilia bacterium]|nr:PilZ domain-containing protein [Desulfomonilia bacterium]